MNNPANLKILINFAKVLLIHHGSSVHVHQIKFTSLPELALDLYSIKVTITQQIFGMQDRHLYVRTHRQLATWFA